MLLLDESDLKGITDILLSASSDEDDLIDLATSKLHTKPMNS